MDEVVIEDATVTAGAAPYVDAVRARIRRLPRARRAELLDDLSRQLEDLAAEPNADLLERLGDPRDFADEFLSSAGVEVPSRRSVDTIGDAVRDRFTAVVDHRWIAAVLDFLPELRPAWWVVRGYLPAAAVMSLYGATPFPFSNSDDHGIGRRLVGTAVALGAAALSVWLGRQPAHGRREGLNRWASVVGVVAVLLATYSLTRVDAADARVVYRANPEAASPRSAPTIGLVYSAEGNQITNFWVYDLQGNLLREVYVFDQEGRPVSTPAVNDQRRETRIPTTRDGQPVVNLYPQDEQLVLCSPEYGSLRSLVPVEEPLVAIPGLRPLPRPPTTTSPSTTVGTTSPTTIVRPEAGYGC